MKVYSYSEARQQLAEVLNRARREGEVEIRRRDGQVFVVHPVAIGGSPLDVPAVKTRLSREEVVRLVRESRRSTERFVKRAILRNKHPQPARTREKLRLLPGGCGAKPHSATRRSRAGKVARPKASS